MLYFETSFVQSYLSRWWVGHPISIRAGSDVHVVFHFEPRFVLIAPPSDEFGILLMVALMYKRSRNATSPRV